MSQVEKSRVNETNQADIYHVWSFFSEWIPVRYVYSLEEVIAVKIREILEAGEKEAPSAITIEMFPWKNRRKTKEPGQAIKLPYGIHLIGKQRSYFCDDRMMPVQNLEQWFGIICFWTYGYE